MSSSSLKKRSKIVVGFRDFLTCAESQSDHMMLENHRDQVTAWNGFGQSVHTKGSGVEPFSDAAPSRGKHSLSAGRRRGRAAASQ